MICSDRPLLSISRSYRDRQLALLASHCCRPRSGGPLGKKKGEGLEAHDNGATEIR